MSFGAPFSGFGSVGDDGNGTPAPQATSVNANGSLRLWWEYPQLSDGGTRFTEWFAAGQFCALDWTAPPQYQLLLQISCFTPGPNFSSVIEIYFDQVLEGIDYYTEGVSGTFTRPTEVEPLEWFWWCISSDGTTLTLRYRYNGGPMVKQVAPSVDTVELQDVLHWAYMNGDEQSDQVAGATFTVGRRNISDAEALALSELQNPDPITYDLFALVTCVDASAGLLDVSGNGNDPTIAGTGLTVNVSPYV